jgi:hypothetical protein
LFTLFFVDVAERHECTTNRQQGHLFFCLLQNLPSLNKAPHVGFPNTSSTYEISASISRFQAGVYAEGRIENG